MRKKNANAPRAQLSVEQAAEVFKMLADKSRLQLLLLLAQEGELNVTALCQALGQSQPAVSHHLTLLRLADLVRFRSLGKQNYYSLSSDFVRQLLDFVQAHPKGNSGENG